MIINDLKSIRSEERDLKSFGRVVGIGFLLMGMLLGFLEKSFAFPLSLIGGAFLALGFIKPLLLLPFQKIWMAIAVIFGWITTRIILGSLFYIVFSLMHFFAWIFKKPLLDFHQKNKDTFWVPRENAEKSPRSYEKQF